jgi:hypothetical protein
MKNKDKKMTEAMVVLAGDSAAVAAVASHLALRGPSAGDLSTLGATLGDVLCMIRYLVHHGYLSQDQLEEALLSKEHKLKYWSTLYE